MRDPRLSGCGSRIERGFTLIEMLISVVILAVLVVLVGQIVNGAVMVTTASRKHMEADSQARLVFDRIASDFARMVRRRDVDCIFSNQSGNDAFFFYSEAPAYSPSSLTNKSGVALVGYRIKTVGSSSFQLERLGKALTWNGAASSSVPGGMSFLTFGSSCTNPLAASTIAGNWPTVIGAPTDVPPYSNGTDPAYHVLAESVFRMEFCFQVKDLSNPNFPGAAYSTYPIAHLSPSNQSSASPNAPTSGSVGDRWYDTVNNRAFICSSVNGGTPSWQSLGLDDVLGVVVALAVLDSSSQQAVKNPQTHLLPANIGNSMVAAFRDVTNADLQHPFLTSSSGLMAVTWQAALISPNFATVAGIPKAVANQVRVYQRLFSLSN